MSFIKDLPDQFIEDEDKNCISCGQKSSAFWVGYKTIYICEQCAIDVLPKLIADSIISNLSIQKIVKDSLHMDFKREKDIQISFDQGVECAILRKIKEYLDKK